MRKEPPDFVLRTAAVDDVHSQVATKVPAIASSVLREYYRDVSFAICMIC
jgi:hypothetical protein